MMERLVEEGRVVCLMQIDGITYGLGFRIEDADRSPILFRKMFDNMRVSAIATLLEKEHLDPAS